MGAIPAAAGWHTVPGRRPSNEDAVLAGVLPDGRELAAVADGMGGHKAGEVASQTALEMMLAGLKAGRSLQDAVTAANTALYAAAQQNPEWAGMGTTLVALLRDGNQYQIANVGDSRAYQVSEGGVDQITSDHSFMAEAVSAGEMTLEDAKRSRWRNALTRAVGTEAELEVDVFGPFDASRPHAVVLCSDGLYGSVSAEALQRCLQASPDPQAAAHRLIDEAYRNGSSDNISVAVIVFAAAFGMANRAGVATTTQQAQPIAGGPLWPNWRRASAERRRRRHHSWLHRLIRFIMRIPPHTPQGVV
jgi:protein phosphatase